LTSPSGLSEGNSLTLLPSDGETPNPTLKQGETQPPGRYRGHSLVKAMKDSGIGRPSTYASMIQTLLDRKYIQEDGGALVPTPSGRLLWLEVAPLYALADGETVFSASYTSAMESSLDDIAEGSASAAAVWQDLLAAFRDAHAGAQKLRSSGRQSPAQRERLAAMAANAPPRQLEGIDLDELSGTESSDLVAKLKEEGVSPAPSARQLAEITRLLGKLGLTPTEEAELTGVSSVDAIGTSAVASALIDTLKDRLTEVTEVSARQLRFLAELVKKAGLTEAAACKRVGATGFAGLTGGQGGTASELISQLKPKRGKSS
jgi:hypothetical protein